MWLIHYVLTCCAAWSALMGLVCQIEVQRQAKERRASRAMSMVDEEQEEEQEEVPEDLKHLDPEQQQRLIMRRSFWMMGAGTALVILFSDPMVEVLGDLGRRLVIQNM